MPRIELAYLGPEGTYGHQAAAALARRVGDDVALVPCASIAAAHAHPTALRVLPLENTLHGAVLETLDCLLAPPSDPGPSAPRAPRPLPAPRAPRDVVLGETTLRIEHLLVARRGVRIEDVGCVRSHEQALGQSSAFLSARLPHAALERYPSTAAAAVSLLDPRLDPIPDREPSASTPCAPAAICSRAAYDAHADALDVLHVGTQGSSDNYTRFLLLAREGVAEPALAASQSPAAPTGTSKPYTSFFALYSAAGLGALAAHGDIASVHCRPASGGRPPFPRHYLVELPSDSPLPATIHPHAQHLGTYQP